MFSSVSACVVCWYGLLCGGLLSDLLVGLACVAEFFHSFVLVAICTGIACVLYLRSQFLFSLCYTCQPPRSQGLSSPYPKRCVVLSSTFGETIDQPEPISFFPRLLLGEVINDTGTGTRFHTMSLI